MDVSTFVEELSNGNEALFTASEMQVEAFFQANPSKDALVAHFRGRCANEFRNMEEVCARLLRISTKVDRSLVRKLAKQIFDEANHFNMVSEVLEYLTGEPLDTAELCKEESEGGQAKGVTTLEEFDEDDVVALYTYQFIAEGRAHRVWQKMANIIDDTYISQTYAKIAKDELFHSTIGRHGIEEIAVDESTRERVLDLAGRMRRQLYEVSARNTMEVPEARALCEAAYGS